MIQDQLEDGKLTDGATVEEMAVAKAKKTEPNETKETMQASQSLAHDIRPLLTEVVSLAKILSNSDLDQKQRRLLDAIMSNGELAFELINDNVELVSKNLDCIKVC